MDVRDRWPLAERSELRDALIAAYAEQGRSYHDLRHLAEVLDRLDELRRHGTAFDERLVVLAAWFHDAVYDGQPGAEERSAQWAEDALPGLDLPVGDVREVARLVRLTEAHDPPPGDRNGAALTDADLAILAAPPDRYREYVHAVRGEYAAVPDPDFRAGRAAVLRALVGRPRVFSTDYALVSWETAARRNVMAELEELERSTG